MPERHWTVYIHILKQDPTRVYVGVTGRDPEVRWANGAGYYTQHRFACAIKHYGFDAFEHFIFASNLTEDEAYSMEKTLIKRFREENYHIYNITSGGKGSDGRKGHHNSKSHNESISKANRGKKLSAEQREASRQRCLDRKSGWYSVPGAKSPFSNTRGAANCKARKVYVFDLDWNFIAEYDTQTEAYRELEKLGSRPAISACCRGRVNKTGGYRFSYFREDPRALS